MSDRRHCDGPQCDEAVPLGDYISVISSLRAERFITLDRGDSREPLHFHNQTCLTNWTKQSTTERAGRVNER